MLAIPAFNLVLLLLLNHLVCRAVFKSLVFHLACSTASFSLIIFHPLTVPSLFQAPASECK